MRAEAGRDEDGRWALKRTGEGQGQGVTNEARRLTVVNARALAHNRSVMKQNQKGRQESLEEGYESLKAQLMQYLDLRDRPYAAAHTHTLLPSLPQRAHATRPGPGGGRNADWRRPMPICAKRWTPSEARATPPACSSSPALCSHGDA